MSRQLKKMLLPGGVNATEKACGDYVCKYCGGRATACNFVANMCLQVYARHQGLCGAYRETETYMGYITECSTCEFQGVSGECCMRERQLWDDVSPTKRKVHQALY